MGIIFCIYCFEKKFKNSKIFVVFKSKIQKTFLKNQKFKKSLIQRNLNFT